MDYLVTWEIEVKADNPIEAAKLARAAQTRLGTRSTLFRVHSQGVGEVACVDLTAIAEEAGSQGPIA
jgi:hypothetical protein